MHIEQEASKSLAWLRFTGYRHKMLITLFSFVAMWSVSINGIMHFPVTEGYVGSSPIQIAINYGVMIKVDKDYKNAQVKDSDSHTRSIAEMTRGELDSMFFVSTPGTKAIGRINEVSELEFKDCWDGDFDDYKVNGKQLYTKVKVGKKNGYSNNFVTFRVPAVVIANKDFLTKNKSMFDTLFDATNMTYKAVKGAKKLEYYPED